LRATAKQIPFFLFVNIFFLKERREKSLSGFLRPSPLGLGKGCAEEEIQNPNRVPVPGTSSW